MQNIKDTVFDPLPENDLIEKNQYTDMLLGVHVTKEFLAQEFDPKNTDLKTAKTMVLPKIADDVELVRFAYGNNLLTDEDIAILFCNLIICFDTAVDTSVMDYIYQIKPMLIYTPVVLKCFGTLLRTITDSSLAVLLDWYERTDYMVYISLLSRLVIRNENVLRYIDTKPADILVAQNYQITHSLCASLRLDRLHRYLDRIQGDLPYNEFINYAILNSDVFLYFYAKTGSYKTDNLDLILRNFEQKNYDVATIMAKGFDGAVDSIATLKYIHSKSDVDMLRFVAENIKIDIHANNDFFLRYLLADEYYEMLKYLFDNEERFGSFYNANNKKTIDKIINFVDNEDVLELLRTRCKI